MNRRDFIKGAAGLFLPMAPAIIRPHSALAQFNGCPAGFCSPKVAAAPSGSGWGDHGTEITLSTTAIANDTMTANSTSSFTTARGTQFHPTGKFYYEIKLLTAPGANALRIGLIDGATANGAPMDSNTVPNGITTYGNDGTALVAGGSGGLAGVNLGSAISMSNGDVLAVAYDATNGFHYLATDHTGSLVWFLSGNPTSGASGTGHIGAYTSTDFGLNLYPAVSIWGLVNCVVQLVTGAGALTYSPPSGYTAWG